jgi:hypothetical protein
MADRTKQLQDDLELAADKFRDSEVLGALAALGAVTDFTERKGIGVQSRHLWDWIEG